MSVPPGRRESPPKTARRLLERLLPAVEFEVIAGDLEEEFTSGRSRAWFWKQALLSIWACRDRWMLIRTRALGALAADVRFSGRSLLRSPGFLLLAVLTLGLAIGANTAVFSVVNGVLWQPLPYPDYERLGLLRISVGNIDRAPSLSAPELLDFRERSRLIADVAAEWSTWNVVRTEGTSDRIRVSWATANLFPLLGLQPRLGRGFTSEEEDPEGPNQVVVLSHRFWQSRFGGDPDIVGRRLALEGGDRTIVGVMGEDARILLNSAATNRPGPDVWIPNTFWTDRDVHWLRAVVRLEDGVSWEQAQAEVDAITTDLVNSHTEYAKYSDLRFPLDPLYPELVKSAQPALLTLWAMVALVLAIACVNVGAMLLARAEARRVEVALRGALGAGRWRVAMLILSESLLLALAAGGLGIALALAFQRGLLWMAPEGVPRLAQIQLDMTVMAFCVLISLATVLIVGAFPILQLWGRDLVADLKAGSGRAVGGSRNRFQRVLVAAEVALAFVLLVGAGLMARSLQSLYDVDLGFRPDDVVTLRLNMPSDRYPEPVQRKAFVRDAVGAVEADEAVVAAGVVNLIPLASGFLTGHIAPEGRQELLGQQEVDYSYVTSGYLKALDVEIVAGRLLNDVDIEQDLRVVVLDEVLARQFWPDESAIGKRVQVGIPADDSAEVVGVVKHIRSESVRLEGRPQIFLPYEGTRSNFYMAVRTRGDRDLSGMIRTRLRQLDPEVPVSDIRAMSSYVQSDLADVSFTLALMACLAGLALLLTVAGTYGIIACWVNRATRSFGVRMALGAVPSNIAAMVVRQGLLPLVGGLIAGVGGALLLGRSMEALLYGVSSTDTATFTAIAVLLVVVTLTACLIPARRATRVEPVVALKGD